LRESVSLVELASQAQPAAARQRSEL